MVFMGLFIIRGMFSLFANVRLDRPPSLAFVRSTVAVAALHTEVESSDENDIELQEAIAASIPTSTAVTATTAALPASMIEIEPVDVQAERAVARTKRRITKAKKHVQIMVESKSASRNSSEGMREAIAASVALSDESQFVDPLVAVRRLPSWASSFTPAPRFAYLFTTQFEAEYDSNIFSNRAAWHWSLLQQLLNAAPLPVRLSMALLTTVMLILNLAAQPTNVVFLCLIYVISLLLVRVALHNIDISVFRVLLGSFEFWLPVSALLVAVAVEIYQLSLFGTCLVRLDSSVSTMFHRLCVCAGNFRFARLSSTESALASAVWLFNYTFFSVVCLAADSLVPLARLWIVTLFMLFQLQLFVQYFLFGSTGDGDSGHLSICAWHSCTTAATLRAEACLVMALFAVKHIATLVASPTAMGALRTGVGMRRVRL
jgi:hypothetical protein